MQNEHNTYMLTYMLKYKCVDNATNRLRKMFDIDMCRYDDDQYLEYKIAEKMYSISNYEVDELIYSYNDFCNKYTSFELYFIKNKMDDYWVNTQNIRHEQVNIEWDILQHTEQIFQIYKSFA
jgi:hypothetical protein